MSLPPSFPWAEERKFADVDAEICNLVVYGNRVTALDLLLKKYQTYYKTTAKLIMCKLAYWRHNFKQSNTNECNVRVTAAPVAAYVLRNRLYNGDTSLQILVQRDEEVYTRPLLYEDLINGYTYSMFCYKGEHDYTVGHSCDELRFYICKRQRRAHQEVAYINQQIQSPQDIDNLEHYYRAFRTHFVRPLTIRKQYKRRFMERCRYLQNDEKNLTSAIYDLQLQFDESLPYE